MVGGLVTLAALPYFTPGVVKRVTEIQSSIDAKAAELVPFMSDRATLLRLSDPRRLTAVSGVTAGGTTVGPSPTPDDTPQGATIQDWVQMSDDSDKGVRVLDFVATYDDDLPSQVSVGSGARFNMINRDGVTVSEMRIRRIWGSSGPATVRFTPPESRYTLWWDRKWRGVSERSFGVYDENTGERLDSDGNNFIEVGSRDAISIEMRSPAFLWHLYVLVDP